MSQDRLVIGCQNGDRRAQEELFRAYARPMYNVVYRMLKDHDEAQDCVQEAFIKVFGKISTYEGRSTVGAWIKRIVVNQTLNHIKKRKVIFEELNDEFEDEVEEIPVSIDPDDIHDAILNLPSSARVIVSLHLIEGLKHREIAEQLNIGESTSRSQYMRGRKLLREKLAIKYKKEA